MAWPSRKLLFTISTSPEIRPPPRPSDEIAIGPVIVAPRSSRAINTARSASILKSIPMPKPPVKSKLPCPETRPSLPALAVKLSMTSFDPPNRPAAATPVNTMPVTGLSIRALAVRSDPWIIGLAAVPVISAPMAIGPETSNPSTPANRQRVSAAPLNRIWPKSAPFCNRDERSASPLGVIRNWPRPIVCPPLCATARAAALLAERTADRATSTGRDERTNPERVMPRMRKSAFPVGN